MTSQRTRMLRTLFCAVAVILLVTPLVWGRPEHRQTLKKYYGRALSQSLNACTTCHISSPKLGTGELSDEPPPHNPFGARLRELGKELKQAGKPADLITRLKLVADEDADGDGVPNELEILAGRAPGDPKQTPTADELASAKRAREEFHTQSAGYAWEPFRRVIRPPVPAAKNAGWVRNPIDAFIAAAHQTHSLTPRPEAPREILVRRVYLDLIGLPPTPAELHAFLDDHSPDVYEKVVDRLLASPRYGERWGRHWMDVWRYSDWAGWTDGGQIRDSQPHIWRWRDWILEALNADKGYDRMLLEMLAADELCPTDTAALRATGYLARNFKMLSRETWMQDTVNHTAQAFLGITLGCARCHDHMYDPIAQTDYYNLRAIFEPHNVRLDRLPGQPDTAKDGLARVFDADPQIPTYLFLRGDDRNPDKTNPAKPGVPGAMAGPPFKVVPVSLPLTAHAPEKREFVVQESLSAAAQSVTAAAAALEAARKKASDAALAVSATDAKHKQAEAYRLTLEARLIALADKDQQVPTPADLANARQAARQAADAFAAARDAADLADEEAQLAELDATLAPAKYAALTATLSVERIEDTGQRATDPDAWKRAAEAATAAQRVETLLQARRDRLATAQSVKHARSASESAAKNSAENPADKKLEQSASKAAAAVETSKKKLADVEAQLAKVEKQAAEPLSTAYKPRAPQTYPPTSTGRRLAFARWIASRDNPLSARVAVNHIWLRHFGQALVPSMFDFGTNGQRPTHPALLDWLAAELMEPTPAAGASATADPQKVTSSPAPWSMKHLHRLVVTSAAYRMASTTDAASAASDPDDRFLWRYPSRRMEAEVVRDSLLYVAGRLDLTMGGPDIDYKLGLTVNRRSLYFRHAAEKQMEFLKLFDAAAVTECYERKESIVPQQALALANSDLALAQSRLLARKLSAEVGSASAADPGRFVSTAFEHVLSRAATAAELGMCLRFLTDRRDALTNAGGSPPPSTAATTTDPTKPSPDPTLRARENLVHVLMNHNDFVTIR